MTVMPPGRYEVVECLIHPSGLRWIVEACPFCGATHHHGAGEGMVTAHCDRGGSYYLCADTAVGPMTWEAYDQLEHRERVTHKRG